MSDISRVARDTKHGVKTMSEAAVFQAHTCLEALMRKHHRGPHDTWGAALDRAARSAGIKPSYAKRIWQRWQSMHDVSGGALLALKAAYDAQCEHNEKMAAHHRAVREAIEHGVSPHEIGSPALQGMGPQAARPTQAEAPRRDFD